MKPLLRALIFMAAFTAAPQAVNALPGGKVNVSGTPLTLPELQTLTGGPTLITFSGKDVPLHEVAALFGPDALLRDGKMRVQQPYLDWLRREDGSNPLPDTTVSVDWKNVPFWEAARQLEKKTGLLWSLTKELDWSSPDNILKAGNGLRDVAGLPLIQNPFVKLMCTRVGRGAYSSAPLSVSPGAGPENGKLFSHNLTFDFTVQVDPKLPIQGGRFYSVQLETADGKIDKIRDEPEIENDFEGALVSLKPSWGKPFAPGTSLKRVSGVLRLNIVTQTKPWQIPELEGSKPVPIEVGDTIFTLKSAKREKDDLVVELGMTFPGSDKREQPKDDRLDGLQVLDAKGRPLPFIGRKEIHRQSEFFEAAKYGATLPFSLSDDSGRKFEGPFTLQWAIPLEIRPYDIPFELRDIKIP
ncbi:hypothetical protein EON80_18020 [bacterium]|nr:MAG: hypothetical protein EON80_18020 [bacterium]